MVFIFLIENLTICGVKYRYIKYEISGDKFVGRWVSALPILLKGFSVSFTYLYLSTCSSDSDRDKFYRALHGWNHECIPYGAETNINLFYLVKICVASLVFHGIFLSENFHGIRYLRCTVFLTDIITCAAYVVTAYSWNRTSDITEITDIPPHKTLLD